MSGNGTSTCEAEGVARLPKGPDLEHAGAMMPGRTALQGTDDALELQQGEAVVIHGATSGVGLFAGAVTLGRQNSSKGSKSTAESANREESPKIRFCGQVRSSLR